MNVGRLVAACLGLLVMVRTEAQAAADAFLLWDGNETQAEYAKRAGIEDVEQTLQLGDDVQMKLILIPAGQFMMGNPDPKVSPPGPGNPFPCHETTISRPFYMGVTEVTQEQYERVMGKSGIFKRAVGMSCSNAIALIQGEKVDCKPDPCLPVDFVDWNEAAEFCRKASEMTGKRLSLPTEAQWEFAYRAGTTGHYYWAEVKTDKPTLFFREQAWLLDGGNAEYGDGCKPVGLKKPNPWGLYDMAGNVWEWCRDAYDSYPSNPVVDPMIERPASGQQYRIIRGGYFGNAPEWCTAWHRKYAEPTYKIKVVDGNAKGRFPMQGFRVVMAIDEGTHTQ